MTTSEFSLIDRFFKSRSLQRDDVTLGIGDDAAVTNIPQGMQLVSAVDTLVNGIHFPIGTPPFSVGYKALAVNLSDLAAMGAQPAWAMLALTLPEADENWVKAFCDGFFQLAEKHNVQLIGGDTTQGPLTVTIQVMGLIPEGEAITRDGAKSGDTIYVSGTLGDAAAALYVEQNKLQVSSVLTEELNKKLDQPMPQNELGMMLRGIATAAIDISDGLVADLDHILDASEVGACLHQEKIPLSKTLLSLRDEVAEEALLNCSLYGGDDYELCFTAAEKDRQKVAEIAQQLSISVTEIGVIESQKKIRLLNKNVCTEISPMGYQHFSKP